MLIEQNEILNKQIFDSKIVYFSKNIKPKNLKQTKNRINKNIVSFQYSFIYLFLKKIFSQDLKNYRIRRDIGPPITGHQKFFFENLSMWIQNIGHPQFFI